MIEKAREPMRIRLFATCVVNKTRLVALDRMLRSLEAAERNLRGRAELQLSLMLQCLRQEDIRSIPFPIPGFVTIIFVENMIPLSTARNRLLEAASRAQPFDNNSLVGFPDDDCWYPEGVLETIVNGFDKDPVLDFWFCRYSSSPELITWTDFAQERRATMRHLVRNASSITIFLRGSLLAALGGFDESLGLGTSNPGAEDIDLAIAGLIKANRCYFLDKALIGHMDKSRNRQNRGRNLQSSLVVLARYSCKGTLWELVRKIMIGVYFCVRGEMPVRQFLSALRVVFNICNANRTGVRTTAIG